MGLLATRPKSSVPTILLLIERDGAREAFVEALQKARYSVEATSDPAKAFASARRARPDLVVIEAQSEDEDWSCVEELRRIEGLDAVPVIALTTQGDPSAMKRSLLAGCDAFLEEPCEPEVLVLQVGRLLALRVPKATMRRKRFEP